MRSRTAVWLLSVCLALALLLGWLWRMQNDKPPEVVYENPEEWTEAVAREGLGVIRHSADGAHDGTQASEPTMFPSAALGRGNGTTEVRSLGPLSASAMDSMLLTLALQIERYEKQLEESLRAKNAALPRIEYRQMELLKDIYLYMAIRELFRRGNYLTIPVGDPIPPCPKGCKTMFFSQFALASGGLGQPFVIVDMSGHKELKDLHEALIQARSAEQWERIRTWNEKPESERQSWFDDYFRLAQKAGESPSANLTSEEFATFWRMEMLLLDLNAEVVPGRNVLYERTGTARR